MLAVGVFPGTREVRLVDHPEPSIAYPRELKLRILDVGVCGTDRDICAFRFGTAPSGCDHFILGHECLAEVVDIGDGVTVARPGDLVVGVVRKPCDDAACLPCRSERQDFCATGLYRERGIQDMHGFMTEYVVEEDPYVYHVPAELRAVGVLIEPLTIAEKAFIEFQAIDRRLSWRKDRRTAVVLGAGPVGLLGAMLFRAAGFDTWVYSRSRAPNPKAAIVDAIDARYVSSLEVPARDFVRAVGNVDVVYEAMGAAQSAFDVLTSLGANSVFVFTGVPSSEDPLMVDVHRWLLHMIVRNQVVVGTVNAGPDAFESAIRDLASFHARWPVALTSMITSRHPLEAYRDAIGGGGIKNVISLPTS
jgi:threonine dehydrogenase-like Zn-dependent dehydrogenase